TEAMVSWGNSSDSVTQAEHIRYYGYLNGTLDSATVDPYPHQFTMYLTLGIVNTIEVYAVDEAGNRSAPATMTIDLRTPSQEALLGADGDDRVDRHRAPRRDPRGDARDQQQPD